jgi:DNA-binding winged helix-turn-helix (wHTH) protein
MKRNPHAIARLCMRQAWKDEVDDQSRRLLEQAAREIRRLLRQPRTPQPSRN